MNITRRSLLKTTALGALVLITPIKTFSTSFNPNSMEPKDPLKPELVKEFVMNAHGNLEKVKELLKAEPGLVNASWDWGGGDFETGMNAAGHTGRKEIAAYLLESGARMDIFCAAMLGKIDIVKQILTAYPNLKSSKGPHGLMLLHHAKQGGEDSKEVLEYLTSIGAS